MLDVAFNACILCLISWFLWDARDWSFYSRLFPWSIGFAGLLLALIQFGILLRNVRLPASETDLGIKASHELSSVAEDHDGLNQDSEKQRLVTIGCWIVAFFVGIWLLGFRFGSLILTVSFLSLAAKETYKKSIILGVVNYLFFLVLFDLVLGVPLFQGAIAQWTGIESVDGFLLKELVQLWS